MMNRRKLIASSLALPVALSPCRLLAGQTRIRRVVDIHHHFVSPGFVSAKRDVLLKLTGGNTSVLEWSPQQVIEQMDADGISKTVLSLAIPGIWFGDAGEARALAREVNEFAAKVAKEHPGRFGFFAVIPLPDTESSLAEIGYALDTLHADGVTLMSNYDGAHLGDQKFAAVLDELNKRKAVVYVHPSMNPCCATLVPELPEFVLELMFDTARTAASLLMTGTLARTLGIHWVLSHGGGALPMLAGRLSDYAEKRKELMPHFPDGAMSELRRLHYDTANVTQAEAFAALRTMVPASQILFGSDSPGLSGLAQLQQLRRSHLSPADLEAIEHGNADRLMPAR